MVKKLFPILKTVFAIIGVITVLLCLLATITFVLIPKKTSTQSTAQPTTPMNTITHDDIILLVNNYRISKNLPALSMNQRICDLAQTRINEIKGLPLSHDGFLSLPRQADEQLGEDLARDYHTSEQVVNGWKASPAHNAILLSPLATVGCVRNKETDVVLLTSNKP